MIYFVSCPETNAVKIGFATDAYKRFSKIQSDNPSRLVLLATEDGDERREAELHAQFSLLRKRGEWFDYAPTLQAYVATLEPFSKTRRRKPLGGKLGAWVREEGLTLREFGQLVDASYATISRLCAGLNKPSYDLMERIAHVTHGAVLPNDWFDLEQLLLRDEAVA